VNLVVVVILKKTLETRSLLFLILVFMKNLLIVFLGLSCKVYISYAFN